MSVVFERYRHHKIPQGTPSVSVIYTLMGKIAIFGQIAVVFLLSQKCIVTTDHKQEVIDSPSLCVGSNDHERWDANNAIFLVYLRNHAHTIWPRTTIFGKVARGDWRISTVSATPPAKGRRPNVSFFLSHNSFVKNYTHSPTTTTTHDLNW